MPGKEKVTYVKMTPEKVVRDCLRASCKRQSRGTEYTIGSSNKKSQAQTKEEHNMMYRSHVLVCGGTGCTSSNSSRSLKTSRGILAEKGLEKEVKVIRTGCFGLCALGPIVVVYPEGAFYSHRHSRRMWKRSYTSTCSRDVRSAPALRGDGRGGQHHHP